MTRYTPKSSTSKNEHESVSCYRHAPCKHCGMAGHAHDKEKVRHENGWSYNYVCPEQ